MTDWLGLAQAAHNASTTYFDASIRASIEADLRQFQGQHPSGSKYNSDIYKARSRLFRPKTRSAIRKNEAIAAEAFFSTVDVVSVSAQDDSDPIQQASAAINSALLQYRLTKTIPWFMILIGAYQEAQTVGVVASYQYWKYDKKRGLDEPCIELIPVENLRIDPASNWANPIDSSPYVIRLIPMYVKDIKARMQSADPVTGAAKWKTLEDAAILKSMTVYGDSIRMAREGKRTDSKDQSQEITDYSIAWVHENIIEVEGQDYVFHTLGVQDLLDEPKLLKEVYFHNRRPFAMGCTILEAHRIYPSSLPRLTKDVQAEINEVTNQRIDNVKFALNKRYFVKRGTSVDLVALGRNNPNSSVLMDDPGVNGDVRIVDTPDVTASSYNEQDRLNLDFDDLAGAFSQASIQSNRRLNETVGGMELLSAGTNQIAGYQLRTLVETWVEPVLRQLVLLEQQYETDTVVLSLAGKSAKLYQKFGLNEITDNLLIQELTINVNIGMGATNPTEQVQKFVSGIEALKNALSDGVLERYGLNIEEVIKEIFGKLGYRDGKRFFKSSEDPRITALQNTVEELQKALESKTDPRVVAKELEKMDAEILKIKADAIQSGVKSEFAAMQAGEVIAKIPQVAPVADEILRGAGWRVIEGGQDPNLPQPPLMQQDFIPGIPGNTDPMSPGVGALRGIETRVADSV
jgi:hypothetical protein